MYSVSLDANLSDEGAFASPRDKHGFGDSQNTGKALGCPLMRSLPGKVRPTSPRLKTWLPKAPNLLSSLLDARFRKTKKTTPLVIGIPYEKGKCFQSQE